MKTIITLTLDQLTAPEREDLPGLFADAFAEFYKVRERAEEYVSARHNPLRDKVSFRDKAAEVARRAALAKRLAAAASYMRLTDVAIVVPDSDGAHPRREGEP